MTDVRFAEVSGHRYTEKTKRLQLQIVAAASDDGESSETGYGDAFGVWCVIAPPAKRELDTSGSVKGVCEAVIGEFSDHPAVLGTSDVRVSKYAQDLLPGDCAFVNAYGSRLALKEHVVALNHGGGFLSFDSTAKTVALVGIPSAPGGGAPYLSISSSIIGLVSATGQASVTVSGNGVTISGSTLAISAGRIDLGKGAAEPIVTYSMLVHVLAQLAAAGITILPPKPGNRVLVPLGG